MQPPPSSQWDDAGMLWGKTEGTQFGLESGRISAIFQSHQNTYPKNLRSLLNPPAWPRVCSTHLWANGDPQLCRVATPQPSHSDKAVSELPNTLPHCVQPPQRHTGLDGKQGVPLMKLQHIKKYYSFVFSGFRQCNVIYSKKCWWLDIKWH